MAPLYRTAERSAHSENFREKMTYQASRLSRTLDTQRLCKLGYSIDTSTPGRLFRNSVVLAEVAFEFLTLTPFKLAHIFNSDSPASVIGTSTSVRYSSLGRRANSATTASEKLALKITKTVSPGSSSTSCLAPASVSRQFLIPNPLSPWSRDKCRRSPSEIPVRRSPRRADNSQCFPRRSRRESCR